ncbi:MAG: YceI family protein [Ferruginibacter sp.]
MKTIWKIDHAHSEILFRVKYLMLTTITGWITSFDMKVETDDHFNKTSRILFTGAVNSIITNNEERDQHLKSSDFFNAKQYPLIKFTGRRFKQSGGDLSSKDIATYRKKYQLYGDLTIKNITRAIVLDVIFEGMVADNKNQPKAGFSISGKISQKDFNLKLDGITDTGTIFLSDEVIIKCQVQLIKQEQVEALYF